MLHWQLSIPKLTPLFSTTNNEPNQGLQHRQNHKHSNKFSLSSAMQEHLTKLNSDEQIIVAKGKKNKYVLQNLTTIAMSINDNNLGEISDKESQKITNKFKDLKEIQRGYEILFEKNLRKENHLWELRMSI